MTIDDRQELGSFVLVLWVRVLMLGRRVEGTDSLASIISSQDRTTGLQHNPERRGRRRRLALREQPARLRLPLWYTRRQGVVTTPWRPTNLDRYSFKMTGAESEKTSADDPVIPPQAP
ncbi:hypothetical protein THAOC_12814 [Thalassiosira oceanica]|uniref:Uncharacterized protein n=1 Tax=Thalassiosira oceanica TaxID=159749 RepID=K0SLT7_THAOC|nr:hypothetical protein THAOC_12814 [Thalassiosira oceanica]|eukprot:EJK66275.1 hypothetical protein THAOC_12814 [Thalassiosira oceanica]